MIRPLLLLSLVFFIASCKSTSSLEPINSGKDDSWTGEVSYQVLVMSKLFNPKLREYYETEMVRALSAEGVNAIPSFAMFPNLSSVETQSIGAIIKDRKDVALFVSEAFAVNRTESSSGVAASSIFSKLSRGSRIDWSTRFSAIMQDTLFVNGIETAVWWNRTKLEADESDARDALKSLIQKEVKLMKKADAIQRLQ